MFKCYKPIILWQNLFIYIFNAENMMEIASDFETEFIFRQKVTDYVQMSNGTFLDLLKLVLQPDKFNMLICELENTADSFVKNLKNNAMIFEDMDKIITSGMVKIEVGTADFSYSLSVPKTKIDLDLNNKDIKLSSGNKYNGQWKDLKHNGVGTLTFSNGSIYKGDFVNNYFEGKGKFITHNGQYEGSLRNNIPDGFGIKNWTTGQSYKGNWKDGKYNGKGIFTFKTGGVYEGDFVDGKFCGTGCIRKSWGDTYTGNFTNDEYSGQGILVRANGNTYEGDFYDNKYHGLGTYIWKNGSTLHGKFIYGKPVDWPTEKIWDDDW